MKFFDQRTFGKDPIKKVNLSLETLLPTIDQDAHFERRRLQAPLFRKEALEYYEHKELLPSRVLRSVRRPEMSLGGSRGSLCVSENNACQNIGCNYRN